MSNLAVIETGGKQYCVEENSLITVESFAGCEEGKEVNFDKVLLFDDGATTQVGTPYLEKKVVGKIEKVGKSKKISVIRFRAKSNYKRHYGHRQPFCQVRIQKIA